MRLLVLGYNIGRYLTKAAAAAAVAAALLVCWFCLACLWGVFYLAVSARKKEGIVSSSSSVATFFTTAWPHEVPVCLASDSKTAAPAHSHESSPVARRT